MDDTDKEILKIIQEDFPLSPEPFADVASRTGLSEAEVISRIAALKEAGVIRRIGAVLDAKSVGVVTILCAARIPEERIDEVARIVNRQRKVTHNYQREGDYNLWFTVWGNDRDDMEGVIRKIEREAAISVVRLPAVKTYKIRAVFDPA